MAFKNSRSAKEMYLDETRTVSSGAHEMQPGYYYPVPANMASTDRANRKDSYSESRGPHSIYTNEGKRYGSSRPQLRDDCDSQFSKAWEKAGRSQKPNYYEGRQRSKINQTTRNAYMNDSKGSSLYKNVEIKSNPVYEEIDDSCLPYSNAKRRSNQNYEDHFQSTGASQATKYLAYYVPSHSQTPYPYGPTESRAGMQQLTDNDRTTISPRESQENGGGRYISPDRQYTTPVYPQLPQTYTATTQQGSHIQGPHVNHMGQLYNNKEDHERIAVATVQQPHTLYNCEQRPEDEKPLSITQTAGYIIFKRVMSACFIILDFIFDWLEYVAFTTNTIYANIEYASFCPLSPALTSLSCLHVFIGLSTVYVIFQLINICGETLLEFRKTDDSSTIVNRVMQGFQLRHGYIETLLSLLCFDLPQLILALSISIYIHFDAHAATITLLGFIISIIKNIVRLETCKHNQGQTWECSKITCDVVPMCTVFYIRPCGGAGNKPCIERDTYHLLSDCSYRPNGVLFGEIKTDPEWAKRTFNTLNVVYVLLYVAMFLIVILRREVVYVNIQLLMYAYQSGQ